MKNETVLQKLRGANEHLSCAKMMIDNDNSDMAIKSAIECAQKCITDCLAEDDQLSEIDTTEIIRKNRNDDEEARQDKFWLDNINFAEYAQTQRNRAIVGL